MKLNQWQPTRYLWALVAVVVVLSLTFRLTPRVVRAQATSQQTDQTNSGNMYLPQIIDAASGGTTEPPPDVTPGPVTDFLPEPDDVEVVRPQGGMCTTDSHLVDDTGAPDIFAPDTIAYQDADYRCVPDGDPTTLSCSSHGNPTLSDGVAACSCNEGYAGATCDVCAAGYTVDQTTQTCRLDNSPELNIQGIGDSLEPAQSTELQALNADGSAVAAKWTIGASDTGVSASSLDAEAMGCLYPLDDPQQCLTTVNGTRVGYRAPSALASPSGPTLVPLAVTPTQGNFKAVVTSVVVVHNDGIPINGYGVPEIAPLLQAVNNFMRQRCVGAGVLGVALYGKPLGVYGLGRMDGRAAADWNASCGDNLNKPLASHVTNDTPMRIGSVSKSVTFAILRWVLKQRLAGLDTDLDIVPLSGQQLVTAQRNLDGQLHLDVWQVNSAGVTARQGNGYTHVRVKDFQLAALPPRVLSRLCVPRMIIFASPFRTSTAAAS